MLDYPHLCIIACGICIFKVYRGVETMVLPLEMSVASMCFYPGIDITKDSLTKKKLDPLGLDLAGFDYIILYYGRKQP
jgi:hypothetical protein